MPDLEIIFKTKAELEGARQLQSSLERQIGAAKAAGKDFSELQKQLDKVNASLASVGKEGAFEKLRGGLGEIIPGFSQLDGIITKLGAGGLAAVAAGFAAVGATLEGAKKSLDEFTRAEANVARIDAALAQRGLLTDQYREKLQELAHELQHTTGVAEDQWLGVLTKLTQFGADPSNIHEYADAVKNLAGILGGDLQTSATLVARALQGNYQMFARYGIQVDEAGTQTEKLEGLFRQLAQRGGGQLEAVTKTLSGHFTDVKNSSADMFKQFGRGIAETGVLQHTLQFLSDVASGIAERFAGPIEKVDGLGNAAVSTTQKIEGATPSAAYANSLERIKVAAELATLKLEGLKGAAQAFAVAEDEIANAKREHELADVEAQVQAGTLSKPEGDRQKGLIEARGITDAAERKKRQLDVQDYFAAADYQVKDYAAHVAQGKVDQLQAADAQYKDSEQGRIAREQAKKDVENLRRYERERVKRMRAPGYNLDWDEEDKYDQVRELARRSRNRAQQFGEGGGAPVSPEDLAKAKSEAKAAADAAATAKQQYENSRRVIDIQRGAVDAVTPEKLAAQQTRSATEAARAAEEEEKKKDEEFKKRLREHQQHGTQMDSSSIDQGTREITNGVSAVKEKITDAFGQISETVEVLSDALDKVSQRLAVLDSRMGNRA